MRTWTATALVPAPPEVVLDVLTDPAACTRWSPIPFAVEGDCQRLEAGTRTRVSGRLAGVGVQFDVQVHAADRHGLALSAHGPIALDVVYEIVAAERGCEIRASVGVRPRGGVRSVLLVEATAGLLSAGALRAAVGRIGIEAALVAR